MACGDKVSSLRHIKDTPEHGQDELCSERPGQNGWRSVCVGRRRGQAKSKLRHGYETTSSEAVRTCALRAARQH